VTAHASRLEEVSGLTRQQIDELRANVSEAYSDAARRRRAEKRRERRLARARAKILVRAAPAALLAAERLGWAGKPVLEVAAERAIADGLLLRQLPGGDRIWLVDHLAVRTRYSGSRTADDGRAIVTIVGVEPHLTPWTPRRTR
jgi:hypothetical protein